jgi:FkbM family methyltransferase
MPLFTIGPVNAPLLLREFARKKTGGEAPAMIDLMEQLPMLCKLRGFIPKGVIHIGAHVGREIQMYMAMGIKHALLIEANPDVYARLAANVAHLPHVRPIHCAIADYDGAAVLRVVSNDQSSSLLKLKLHAELYPQYVETKQITVPCRKLDTLMKEQKLRPEDFDLLVIDIQGAELLALQGAVETLRHMEAILTEVNLDELYEGCALLDDIDRFLDAHRFRRFALSTPLHPSWGDAFYWKLHAAD